MRVDRIYQLLYIHTYIGASDLQFGDILCFLIARVTVMPR